MFPCLCASAFVLAAHAGGHICVEALLSSLQRRHNHVLAGPCGGHAALRLADPRGSDRGRGGRVRIPSILRIPTAWGEGGLTVACALLPVTALTAQIEASHDRVAKN
ncbi:hypothetical protein J4E08_03555 [Sagittula sp. NFXS13]|uniref:hypothetical protein n=1 Tax=Sagittula sp. NFXS13 TaxID=2819095 RepID=UPI0032DF7EEA